MRIAEQHHNGARIELQGLGRVIRPILEEWRAFHDKVGSIRTDSTNPSTGFVRNEENNEFLSNKG